MLQKYITKQIFFNKCHLLWQVVDEYSVGIFPEILLECLREENHRLTGGELKTLNHALLVVHEQVRTARQNIAVAFEDVFGTARLPPGGVFGKPLYHVGQVSLKKDEDV